MKSFTDKQSAVALVLIFLLFCYVSNDDFTALQVCHSKEGSCHVA